MTILMTLSVPAFAGPALDSLALSAGGAEELLAPAPVRAAPAYTPKRLKWGYTLEELRSEAAYGFTWAEDNYRLRMLFGRGLYDSYAKTFKAQPELMLEIIEGQTWPGIPFEADFDKYFDLRSEPQERLNLFRDRDNVHIAVFLGEGDAMTCPFSDSVPIKSLYSKWAAWASGSQVTVFDKRFFMVPQASKGEEFWSYGYVLSEKSPLQKTTGLPQDYVELFRENAEGMMDFKPKAYSLPLGLVFELQEVNDELGSWDVRPMLESEMQEAINDSLGGRKGFLPAAAALKAVK